jgi:hypothetical protein
MAGNLSFFTGSIFGCALTFTCYYLFGAKLKKYHPKDSLTRDFLQIMRIGRTDFLMMAYACQTLGRIPKLLKKSKEKRLACLQSQSKLALVSYLSAFKKYQSLIEEELSSNIEKIAFYLNEDSNKLS